MLKTTRREFIAGAALVLWLPWFRSSHVDMAGIRFAIIRRGGDRRRYLWVHGNEQTAGAVLREHMRTAEGRAFLIESTQRNVRLLDGEIDPNRMWSRAGAAKNLLSLNAKSDDRAIAPALDALDRDRERAIRQIVPRDGRLLVALHNNSASYSVKDEIPISDRTSIKRPDRPHEFMLATDARDFERLAATPFNVVLQAGIREEDGSFSQLATRLKVRYVNIECSHGAAAEQKELLAAVERLPVRY